MGNIAIQLWEHQYLDLTQFCDYVKFFVSEEDARKYLESESCTRWFGYYKMYDITNVTNPDLLGSGPLKKCA